LNLQAFAANGSIDDDKESYCAANMGAGIEAVCAGLSEREIYDKTSRCI
jgi:hypothetical protein